METAERQVTAPAPTRPAGLTPTEVEKRRAAGRGNQVAFQPSRSYANILRYNLLNPFNVILFLVGALLLALGRWNDAILSVGLVLFNAVVGTVQEIRAKRKLDEIALLARPKVTVIRASEEQQVDPGELVEGDVLLLRPGDQVVVDGPVIAGSALEMDEALLSGESNAVRKITGDTLLSGSFAVSGSAYYRAEKVGGDSYANQITATARQFQVSQTPLQREINFVLRLLTIVAVFYVSILFFGTFLYDVPPVRFAQTAAIIMGIISAGLLFTIILAYALGAVRLANEGALVQQSNAIESLSHVDVLCTDKTGTLTANRLELHEIYVLEADRERIEAALSQFAAGVTAGNQTIQALKSAFPAENQVPADEVPFSSARKWSALAFNRPEIGLTGAYALGAPEMLAPYLEGYPGPEADGYPAYADQLETWAAEGLRVLLFAHHPTATGLHDAAGEPQLPPLRPLALVSLRDELRPQVQETIAGFHENGITLKIISGDHPETVAALARQAGLPVALNAVSGSEVDAAGDGELEKIATSHSVFGRITPEQKQRLVDALRRQGHYVAMIGDGVNDVLPLKQADVGVAMQSGSAATRGVADLILLDDSFAALVPAFREGQRIVSGMGNILRIYLPRLLSVALLINVLSLLQLGFPTVPTQEAFTTLLTVGIPTVMLTIWARPAQPPKRLLPGVAPFVLTAMLLITIFGVLVYVAVFAYFQDPGRLSAVTPEMVVWLEEFVGFALESPEAVQTEAAGLLAQSALTLFRMLVGILIILFIAPPLKLFAADRPVTGDRRPTYLALAMLLTGIVFVAVPGLRAFFGLQALTVLPLALYGILLLAVFLWLVAMCVALKRQLVARFLRPG